MNNIVAISISKLNKKSDWEKVKIFSIIEEFSITMKIIADNSL